MTPVVSFYLWKKKMDRDFIKTIAIAVPWFLIILIAYASDAPGKFYGWYIMVSTISAPAIVKLISLSKGQGHGNFMDDYGMLIGFFGAIIFLTIIMF
jgi:hypothetical protein